MSKTMDRLRVLLARLRGRWDRSGFILNLQRVLPLVIIWAVLANLAVITNRDIFFRLSYLILLVVAAAFIWALYSVQSFTLGREPAESRVPWSARSRKNDSSLSARDAFRSCGLKLWMRAICPGILSGVC